MPLFFLVSGFFTMMLARRKGLKKLVGQRLLRIGVPLLVGTMIMVPLMAVLGAWGGEVRAERAGKHLTGGD
jgi:fucose 4-O-acetylase-like acetyltransferase